MGTLTIIIVIGLNGCGAYRTDSGITPPSAETKTVKTSILVTKNSLDDKNCTVIQNIEATVKKLTLFHADPTKEQVDFVLAEKGKKLGANVVKNVKYESGIGMTTWGYIDGEGEAAKCDLK